jgi:shikimate dehydrogenase
LEIAIAAKTILLIGAGGAARGIIGALIANAPAAIQIVNRTPAKAQTLAAAFAADCAVEIASGGMGEARPAQIVINAAAAGFAGEAPPLSPAVFKQCEIAYDLSYGAAAKPFMALAKQSGAARVCDGLGMLAEQAALSFALWEKVKPATRGIIAALRADL